MGIAKYLPYAAAALLGVQAVAYIAHPTDGLIRPPGAQGEKDFSSRCVKCGRCIEACPYAALVPASADAGSAVGSPTLDLRNQACRLCHDFPCAAACPTDALRDVAAVEDVDMGHAVIDEDLCIALQGMRCEVCYRACPLIDRAITIDYRLREGDSIHSVFAPVIDEQACVGCGLCVERCVIGQPEVAIKVVRGNST
ncbi:4Fe-4S dicluster domain-containing protein [Raoultibacter timonensis]|uniref:4Fe-4S ferredoxin-type domain-containing protein n=1 Tax=Raoultibacter timonensis TaxID=1907662 RepID=A0ABM7WJ26_9ACTN|nr:4Fe-4S dicluster domain-containing protein [Raoultibacter timonensis]BDE96306.1 hypothetical protein CE91St30_16390 [Raoultibacter timonensis]BDF50911.1 hypothetical protein CE91St31_16410 [Raoultibacter timonensis]